MFIKKGGWILSNAFFASIEIIWFLSFMLLKCYITFNDLCMLNHPCIQRVNPTWLWRISLLMAIEFGMIVFCWEFLHLIHQGYWPIVFFSYRVLIWLSHQGNASLKKWIWDCSLFVILKKEFAGVLGWAGFVSEASRWAGVMPVSMGAVLGPGVTRAGLAW